MRRTSGGGSESGKGAAPVPRLQDRSSLHSIDVSDARVAAQLAPKPAAWRKALSDKLGRLSYLYFNWRQDTWSDLQLFMLLNVFVFLGGAWVEGSIVRAMDESVAPLPEGAGPLHALWYNLYSVLAVVLGQELPAEQAGWPSQLFAIVTAVFGLASFALVLALIEQVVLEVLERNVKRGSACFESGHTVVLAWCESSRDIAQLTRILTQLCAANRSTSGSVVVVLTQQRGKLEMEQLYREVIPESHRFGTRFVFRQGSPLDPAALRMVAAYSSKRIIVCGDYSRHAKDADAQVLRTCVLLDEEIQKQCVVGDGPVVVAQIKTEDALPLVQYACSQRVLPVPTNKINARRYVRLLHNPIATVFSRMLMDQYSAAHAFIDPCTEVEGLPFKSLFSCFPEALVVGLHNERTGYVQLNPPPGRLVQPGDHLITLRPGRTGQGADVCLQLHAGAAEVDLGGWDPSDYVMSSKDEQPLGVGTAYETGSTLAITGRAHGAALAQVRPGRSAASVDLDKNSSQALYVMPLQYSSPGLVTADELLICGWMGSNFMWELLAELDHSDQALPPGSRVTLFNEHAWDSEQLAERLCQYRIHNLEVVHVRGDPRSRADMARLIDVSRYKAAFVVCDSRWADCQWTAGGELDHQILSQAEMLSLDSAMLMVQLNIRLLLEEVGHPSISIICEKLTYVGVTRFEDDTRLPLGIAVNSASYAAKALTQVAVEPRFLKAYMQLGAESDLMVQDASSFAAEGEQLSFLQMQARAAAVRQVLLGWYKIPASPADPLELVVNPAGLDERSKPRVWNDGQNRTKLVSLALTKRGALGEQARAAAVERSSAHSFASVCSSEESDVDPPGAGGRRDAPEGMAMSL